MDAIDRSRFAIQTWFIACGALILASIIGLVQFRGVVAPIPSNPTLLGSASSVALVLGVLGLIALLLRTRSVIVARCASSRPASIVFLVAVLAYVAWLSMTLMDGGRPLGSP